MIEAHSEAGRSMAGHLKSAARTVFERIGLNVRLVRSLQRAREQEVCERALKPWDVLKPYEFRTVIDIGANLGHFATVARRFAPAARIYSLEPLPTCFAELDATLARVGNAEAIHLAAGDEPGVQQMFQNDFTPSSSLLPIGELHVREMPTTSGVREVSIEVARLDDIFGNRPFDLPLLVKLDVQGYEDRAIRGGPNVLRQARAGAAECSSYRLYEGQALFDDIHGLLRDLGFVYRGNIDQWVNLDEGRILQFDALFENSRIAADA